MKLQAGDTIWITKADGESPGGGTYAVNKAFAAEWDGEKFLGCAVTLGGEPTSRTDWSLDVMRYFQGVIQGDPKVRTNIDCMFEQLEAEGTFT